MTTVLALLAFTGWVFSFYFLQVYRGNLPVEVWWIPGVCRISSSSCQRITDTRYGRFYSKPNAFWGCFYYPGLILFILFVQQGFLGLKLLLVPATTAFFFSIYLLWGLYKLGILCRICLLVHMINFAIFILLLLS
ncbi:MAG: vitamin K epoxide reductase family protein [Fidelibacterota bacterium]